MTAQPLDGIRVVEVASWIMAPTAAGVLVDWGATVIKVEPPATGDPVRGLQHRGAVQTQVPLNAPLHHSNRGKRSIGLDIRTEEGHAILLELIDDADVFITNFLPAVRERLRIDVDDLRRRNPQIIYARGSALGPRGAGRDRMGFDFATYWCRSGLAEAMTEPGEYPPMLPVGGLGDMSAGAFLAGGVAAALLQRERTGHASVVDTSLFAAGAWTMSMNLEAAASAQAPAFLPHIDRREPPNPLVNIFATKDDRHLALCILDTHPTWRELCERIERLDLLDDERFDTHAGLTSNSRAATTELDAAFATKSLEEWKQVLTGAKFVWEPVQNLEEVANDPQTVANDYLLPLDPATATAGAPTHLVAAPVQFDVLGGATSGAPELGQHTEEILVELGRDWGTIGQLQQAGVI
jgi:crotonobetainyl-CoA:carnitine CoA-transferase CaiB-like acyl-CoA transferase